MAPGPSDTCPVLDNLPSLAALWALAGAERRLAMYEDPVHRWLHDT